MNAPLGGQPLNAYRIYSKSEPFAESIGGL